MLILPDIRPEKKKSWQKILGFKIHGPRKKNIFSTRDVCMLEHHCNKYFLFFLFVFYFPLLLFTFFNNIQNILFDIILHQYPKPSFSLYD